MNQTEILKQKNKITALKNSIESFNNRAIKQKKESVSMKTGQLKLPNQRKKNEKPPGLTEDHENKQYMHYGSPRGNKEREKGRKLI